MQLAWQHSTLSDDPVQCDQNLQFIILWATFQSPGQHLFCRNRQHILGNFCRGVKIFHFTWEILFSKTVWMLVASCLRLFQNGKEKLRQHEIKFFWFAMSYSNYPFYHFTYYTYITLIGQGLSQYCTMALTFVHFKWRVELLSTDITFSLANCWRTMIKVYLLKSLEISG